MSGVLKPGTSGISLPAYETVVRLLQGSLESLATAGDFELSSQDKETALQSLSVWAERLTTPQQALEFMGDKKELYSLYCSLLVEDVRSTILETEPPKMPLDVVWDNLAGENRSGAEGHAGIVGLLRPPGIPKLLYKDLRSRLADLANRKLYSLDSDSSTSVR